MQKNINIWYKIVKIYYILLKNFIKKYVYFIKFFLTNIYICDIFVMLSHQKKLTRIQQKSRV